MEAYNVRLHLLKPGLYDDLIANPTHSKDILRGTERFAYDQTGARGFGHRVHGYDDRKRRALFSIPSAEYDHYDRY